MIPLPSDRDSLEQFTVQVWLHRSTLVTRQFTNCEGKHDGIERKTEYRPVRHRLVTCRSHELLRLRTIDQSYLDRFASQGVLFENTFSAHIPTTSAYASMLTGMDVFSTQVVALRHQGPLRPEVKTLAEICAKKAITPFASGSTGIPAVAVLTSISAIRPGARGGGRLPKAQLLNEQAIPAIDRMVAEDKPFFLFLRHMDPHAPYLPPEPYERMFYHGDECDPSNKSMEPVLAFKPFRDFLASWLPPGITDKDYVIAQYDGSIAYMDAAIQSIFTALEEHGIFDETIVAINGDHGETLYDHECWFDHHGIYDNVLHVPLMLRYPPKLPAHSRVSGYNQHKDLVPTLLELADIDTGIDFDGSSLLPMVEGSVASHESEIYITECTWMRKHGWRTPQWKLMLALEPDFHFKPPVELYNLVEDPLENCNLADELPGVVAALTARLDAWVSKREGETGLPNPIHHQGDWHGLKGVGPFTSSQQAYDSLYIGDASAARRLQAKSREVEEKE